MKRYIRSSYDYSDQYSRDLYFYILERKPDPTFFNDGSVIKAWNLPENRTAVVLTRRLRYLELGDYLPLSGSDIQRYLEQTGYKYDRNDFWTFYDENGKVVKPFRAPSAKVANDLKNGAKVQPSFELTQDAIDHDWKQKDIDTLKKLPKALPGISLEWGKGEDNKHVAKVVFHGRTIVSVEPVYEFGDDDWEVIGYTPYFDREYTYSSLGVAVAAIMRTLKNRMK